MDAPRLTFPGFDGLDGWAGADHDAALASFRATLPLARASRRLMIGRADWADAAARASRAPTPRAALEAAFAPLRLVDGARPLFTAYYEPEIDAARQRAGPYRHPIHARPPDLGDGPYATRAEILSGALDGRGLELFWLSDPVEAFFLQIQGSGRLRLAEGGVARVGYAGKNNRPYRAVGRLLVERGDLTLEAAHAEGIKAWIRARPEAGAALMNENPSYVFFEEKTGLSPQDGPIGALGVPLTDGFSAAVDGSVHPLGALIWVEAEGVPGFERRLMAAHDVGGAIRGAQRADLFFGSGAVAGDAAGRVRAGGRLTLLAPHAAAARLAASGLT